MGGYILLILPSGFAPGHKLQKPSKTYGMFQSLGTISSLLFLFTKKQSQKGGGHGTRAAPLNTLLRGRFRQREALSYLITLIGSAKKGLHVLRYSIFAENIVIVKNKKMAYSSSDVLFSAESIGEEKKKVFIVCDEVPHFLRCPKF